MAVSEFTPLHYDVLEQQRFVLLFFNQLNLSGLNYVYLRNWQNFPDVGRDIDLCFEESDVQCFEAMLMDLGGAYSQVLLLKSVKMHNLPWRKLYHYTFMSFAPFFVLEIDIFFNEILCYLPIFSGPTLLKLGYCIEMNNTKIWVLPEVILVLNTMKKLNVYLRIVSHPQFSIQLEVYQSYFLNKISQFKLQLANYVLNTSSQQMFDLLSQWGVSSNGQALIQAIRANQWHTFQQVFNRIRRLYLLTWLIKDPVKTLWAIGAFSLNKLGEKVVSKTANFIYLPHLTHNQQQMLEGVKDLLGPNYLLSTCFLKQPLLMPAEVAIRCYSNCILLRITDKQDAINVDLPAFVCEQALIYSLIHAKWAKLRNASVLMDTAKASVFPDQTNW